MLLLLWPKFDNSSPSVTEIKRFVSWLWANDITTSWGEVPNGTLSVIFSHCPNLMSLASPWLKIYRLSNWSFSYFEQFKIDFYLDIFGQVKIDPICSLLLLLDRSKVFTEFGQEISQNLSQNIQEPGIGSSTSYFRGNQELVSSVKGSVLFLSVTRFSDFCNKINIYDKNKDTEKLTELGKYVLNGYFHWQYCQESCLEPNQKSMVELFCKNSNNF